MTQYTRECRSAHITYLRTYRPKGAVDFSGNAFFGGTTGDELMLIPMRYARLFRPSLYSFSSIYTELVRDRDSGERAHWVGLTH